MTFAGLVAALMIGTSIATATAYGGQIVAGIRGQTSGVGRGQQSWTMAQGMMGPGYRMGPRGGGQFAVGDPEHGRPIAEAKCGACHGPDGNSPDPQYPKLAGQNPAYLYGQLWAFRTGARKSDIMAGIAGALSDADMADVASFYGRQTAKPDPLTDARLAALGQRIFLAGVGPGVAPPCAMCHSARGQGGMPMMGGGMMGMPMMGGMGMMGATANVPSLDGQHAAYIVDQLNRFASGERSARVMGAIAAGLSATDKNAVAEYVSTLP
jgi:cytochrome c553